MSNVTIKFAADTSAVTKSLAAMRGAIGKSLSRQSWAGFEAGASASARAMAKLRAEISIAGQKMRGMKWEDLFMGADAFLSLAGRAGSWFSGLMTPAMDMEQYLVSFETLLKSADAAQDYVGELRKFAAETPFEMAGIAEAATNLLAFGTSAEKSLTLLRQLGDVAALTRTPLSDLALIYSKAGATGIDTADVNQLASRGVNLRELWAARDGISTQDVQKRIEKKQYGTADLDYAFQKLSGKGGDFFEGALKQSKTLSGVISTMTDQLTELRVQLGDSMTESIKGAAQYITAEMPRIYEQLQPVVGTMAGGIKMLAVGLPDILAAMNRMAKIMMFFAAYKGVYAGFHAVKGAVAASVAAVGVLRTQVGRLGSGLSKAALAARGMKAALSGIGKLGFGPVGAALAVAELGMFAWDMLKDKLAAGSPNAAPAAAPKKDWSGYSSQEIGGEIGLLEARRHHALTGIGLGMNERIRVIQEYDSKIGDLRDALTVAFERELESALETADARTKAYLAAVEKEQAAAAALQKQQKELYAAHYDDVDSREAKKWQETLRTGNMQGLLAALKSNAVDMALPSEWNTAQEGLAAMLEARRSAALRGDSHGYNQAADMVASLDVLAEREKKSAEEARQKADKLAAARSKHADAMQRARLTIAGDAAGLARMDSAAKAAELSQQYQQQGMSKQEADKAAARLVATQNASQRAGQQSPELITQSRVAVGGGGRSLRLGDAQLDVAKQGVAIMKEQKSILEDVRNLFRNAGSAGIPVTA